MALLQISEPGESPEPHQRKLAAGIDLGTTHSLVATVRSSVAEVIADSEGRPLLPSIVRYAQDGKVVVGYDARAAQADDPANTIVSVKREDEHDIKLAYSCWREWQHRGDDLYRRAASARVA